MRQIIRSLVWSQCVYVCVYVSVCPCSHGRNFEPISTKFGTDVRNLKRKNPVRSCTVPVWPVIITVTVFHTAQILTGPLVHWQLDSLLVDSSLADSIEFRRDVETRRTCCVSRSTWPLFCSFGPNIRRSRCTSRDECRLPFCAEQNSRISGYSAGVSRP